MLDQVGPKVVHRVEVGVAVKEDEEDPAARGSKHHHVVVPGRQWRSRWIRIQGG